MKLFPYGHATHPAWRIAVALVVAQVRARMATANYARSANLGLLYFSDHYARDAEAILEALQDEFPQVTDWAGSVSVGVMGSHAEYMGDAALSVMLLDLPADAYRIFSGIAPIPTLPGIAGFQAETALVHADGALPELDNLLEELSERTRRQTLAGGVSSGIVAPVQIAWSKALAPGHSGVFTGGLSGIAFHSEAQAVIRLAHGCDAVTARMRVSVAEENVVLELDGRPALDVLEQVLQVSIAQHPEDAVRRMPHFLVGLEDAHALPFAGPMASARMRPLLGLDISRRGIVLPEAVAVGQWLSFCQRSLATAKSDLVRMGTEVREELSAPSFMAKAFGTGTGRDPRRYIAGAIYVSCIGRGGPYFGGEHAELELLHQTLGDIPLIGFFSNGQIADRHLHRYSGVLLTFLQPR
ncbi:MAG: FIST signal transduction protein [Comamonas sp.]